MRSRFIGMLSMLAVSSLALSACVGDTNTADAKKDVEQGSVYSLDATAGTVAVTVNYDSFEQASDEVEDGFIFTYDDGEEKGNVVKVSIHDLEEGKNFDDFVTGLKSTLVKEGTTNVFQSGPIEHSGTPGYAWVYESDNVAGLGHVVRTIPAGPQDAILVFGTASGDLNRLEKVIDTFEFEFQEN